MLKVQPMIVETLSLNVHTLYISILNWEPIYSQLQNALHPTFVCVKKVSILCFYINLVAKVKQNKCMNLLKIFLEYRKSSIRSRPCIILNPKFPRLVLEVFQKLQFLEQNFLSEAAHKGPNRVILKDLNFCQ